MRALQKVYSDLDLDDDASVGRFNYPRPISEPSSPSSSRHTTPAASRHGSDDEDEVDDEKEVIICEPTNYTTTLVNDQLDTQLLYFIICLLQSSTCFKQCHAHHQVVKLY